MEDQYFKKHVTKSQADNLVKQLESMWTRSSAKEDIKKYIQQKELELNDLGQKYNSLLDQYQKLNEQNFQYNKQQVKQEAEKTQLKEENKNLQIENNNTIKEIEQLKFQLYQQVSDQEKQKHFQDYLSSYFKTNANCDKYDVQIKFENWQNLKEGIQIKNYLTSSLKYWDRKSQIVGIIGNGNSGKTFLMSSLTGKKLAQGLSQQTQGISIVSTEIQENHVFFIDTPGTGEPLQIFLQYQKYQDEVAQLSQELKQSSFKDYYIKHSKFKIPMQPQKFQTMSFQVPAQKLSKNEIAQMFQDDQFNNLNEKNSDAQSGKLTFQEADFDLDNQNKNDSEEEELKDEKNLRVLYEKGLKEKTEKIKSLKEQIRKFEESLKPIEKQTLYENILYEKFIQNYIFDNCHLIIIVAQVMNKEDEKLINYICKLYQNNPQKEIIVIHNFYQNIVTKEDIQLRIKKEILNCFHVEEGTAPIGINKFCNVYKDYSFDKTKPVIHLILGLKNTNAGNCYNEQTFGYLKQRIGSIQTQAQNFNLLENLKNYLNINLNQYLKVSQEDNINPKFDFAVEEQSTFQLQIKSKYLQNKQFTMREVDYDFFGRMSTNVRQDIAPNYDIWEDEDEICINVDLPGIDDKNQIKFQFPINTQTNTQHIALSVKRKKCLPDEKQKLVLKESNDKNIVYGDLSLFAPVYCPASDLKQDKDGKKVSFKNNVFTVRLFKLKPEDSQQEFTWQE